MMAPHLPALILALTATACIGCSSPTQPSPPPPVVPDPPVITCPTLPPQTALADQGIAVTFSPAVALGAAPVTTTCEPASGSIFRVGTTPVACVATDARQRTSSCTFNVIVQPPPRLSLTRFVAFGDSLTKGEDGNATLAAAGAGLTYPTIVLRGREYPTVLQQLLAARFSSQSLVMVNAGCAGELAAGDSPCSSQGTFARFSAIASTRQYDAVLIMEGTNDIFGGTGGNPLGIPPAIANLRRMIGEARSRGMRIFLATVPPANPAGPRGLERYQAIPPLNAEIRQLAVAEGVPLVDVFNAFGNNLSYLGPDGTHPNAEGYALIANAFYNVLRNELETRGVH